MRTIQMTRALIGMVGIGLIANMTACGHDHTSMDVPSVNPLHEQICKLIEMNAGTNPGYAVPGVAGAPRWGFPNMTPTTKRVRKSWSTLTDAEKKRVVDGFIALKHITTTSGNPGSARANYTSFCDELGLGGYARNLYDFYVEAHVNAYIAMMTPYQTHMQHPHKSPQFLAWHRYLLLRLEADMGEALGDQNFALPYWDWPDCYKDGTTTTCAALFNQSYLGTGGSCDANASAVQGYLTDQGFQTNIYTQGQNLFSTDSIKCEKRPIQRQLGCFTEVAGAPDSASINGIFSRTTYDSPAYDGCYADENVSFRQYLEGFSNKDLSPICVGSGCQMHGRAHHFIGGDIADTTAAPNDPIFFLLHSEVDRLWAAWQDENLRSADPNRTMDHGNPGFPKDYAGPLFNFDQVNASEVFDYKALGYEYDTLPTRQ